MLVYRQHACILARCCVGVDAAASKFLDSVATFTASELLPFNRFVFYTVVTCMVGRWVDMTLVFSALPCVHTRYFVGTAVLVWV